MATDPVFSLVLPVYREGAHLRTTLQAIRLVMDDLNAPYEFVLIDDGSPDNSWEVICQEAQSDNHIRAVRLSRNFGKEAALCAGLEMVRGAVTIVMDADLQHPPEVIVKMINLWQETRVNIVEGIKEPVAGEPLLVRMRRRAYFWLMTRLSGFDLEGASDFKLMDQQVRQAWLKMGERNLFFRGMIAWLGFKRAQVRFTVPARVAGSSGWSLRQLFRLAMTSILAFSTIPLRFASVTGLLFLIFAAVVATDSLWSWWRGVAVPGATTMILLELIVGGAMLLSLGVIGEYIARIYDEIKGRPRYIVAEVANHSRHTFRSQPVASAITGVPDDTAIGVTELVSAVHADAHDH